jgi:hypothetical protein
MHISPFKEVVFPLSSSCGPETSGAFSLVLSFSTALKNMGPLTSRCHPGSSNRKARGSMPLACLLLLLLASSFVLATTTTAPSTPPKLLSGQDAAGALATAVATARVRGLATDGDNGVFIADMSDADLVEWQKALL